MTWQKTEIDLTARYLTTVNLAALGKMIIGALLWLLAPCRASNDA
jgi:hypothetical protein